MTEMAFVILLGILILDLDSRAILPFYDAFLGQYGNAEVSLILLKTR